MLDLGVGDIDKKNTAIISVVFFVPMHYIEKWSHLVAQHWNTINNPKKIKLLIADFI